MPELLIGILIGIAVAFTFVFVIVGRAGKKRDKETIRYNELFLQTNIRNVDAIERREVLLIDMLQHLIDNMRIRNCLNCSHLDREKCSCRLEKCKKN
ncbi:MAG: hypothetical protein PHS34_08810 [Candidatus Omnitrophica bacterium]|nr:hypothetical protein [Candidatus Omnitrophota bacterium]